MSPTVREPVSQFLEAAAEARPDSQWVLAWCFETILEYAHHHLSHTHSHMVLFVYRNGFGDQIFGCRFCSGHMKHSLRFGMRGL